MSAGDFQKPKDGLGDGVDGPDGEDDERTDGPKRSDMRRLRRRGGAQAPTNEGERKARVLAMLVCKCSTDTVFGCDERCEEHR